MRIEIYRTDGTKHEDCMITSIEQTDESYIFTDYWGKVYTYPKSTVALITIRT